MLTRDPHEGLGRDALQRLDARAQELARQGANEEASQARQERERTTYVIFRYLDEQYGLPVKRVEEVVPLASVVPIPGAPGHLVGLTRLRGRILAIVNLRSFFRRTLHGFADSDLAVVTELEGRSFAIVCTAVEAMRSLSPRDIGSVPDGLPEVARRVSAGFLDGGTMLLDPKALIAEPGFVVR